MIFKNTIPTRNPNPSLSFVKNLFEFLKPLRSWRTPALFLCLTILWSSSAKTGEITSVVIDTRKNQDNQQSLMIKVTGSPEGNLDEIIVKLPRDNVKNSVPGLLPEGWILKPEKDFLIFSGPEVSTPCHLRVDMGRSRPPKKADVEIMLDGERQFRKKGIKVTQRPPVRVSDNFDGILKFPSVVSPGDQIEFEPLDFIETPIGGTWKVSGKPAEEIKEKNRYTVTLPDDLTEGDSIPISYTDPYGVELYRADTLPELRVAPPYEIIRPFITGVTELCFPGDTICVCGFFPDLNSRYGLTLNGQPLSSPVSSSSHVVIHRIPEDMISGPQRIGGNPEAGYEKDNEKSFRVIRISGSVDRDVLKRGQSTPLQLWIEGTDEVLQLKLKNDTPNIITLEGGNDQVVSTSGGSDNRVERMVKGIKRGDFKLSYELDLDLCPCLDEFAAVPEQVPGSFTLSGDAPPIGEYLFGTGGDLNADGYVNEKDVTILEEALSGQGIHLPEFDANRDGTVDGNDLTWVIEVASGRRPSLLSAHFIEEDVETLEPAVLVLRGMNLGSEMKVRFGDEDLEPSQVIPEPEEIATVQLYFDTNPEIPEQGIPVSILTNVGSTLAIPVFRLGQAIGNNDESTPFQGVLFQQAENVPEAPLAPKKGNCCITRIVFRGHQKGLRIFVWDDSGKPALYPVIKKGRKRSNGLALEPNKKTTMNKLKDAPGSASAVVVVVENEIPIATFRFDCDNIARGIYHEPQNEAGDEKTRVRPRPLFEIVDFEIESPCTPGGLTIPRHISGGVISWDNKMWERPDRHWGSGALAKISVPLSSISEMGCNRACWMQWVSTVLDKYDFKREKWGKPFFESKFHVDNETAEAPGDGSPWYCYRAQYEETDDKGVRRLVLGDGPHIRHGSPQWIGGKKIEFKKGDVIRRRSVFASQLICYDPKPERVLVTLMWSIATVYTYDPDNPKIGGSTKDPPPPVVVNAHRIPTEKDRKELEKYLEKKKRDRKRMKKFHSKK